MLNDETQPHHPMGTTQILGFAAPTPPKYIVFFIFFSLFWGDETAKLIAICMMQSR